MATSTLRNALARRNHKERAQPLHRKRLGLLEKHKDYVHRARDYKSKQDRIKKLREKAAFRNKDEFYFGMVKQKTKGGVMVGDRGNEALSVDMVKVLKSQDAGWVRVQIAKDEKKISKLRAELEITSPSTSTSTSTSEWNAAVELAEVEKMAEMGIVLRPREEGSGGGSGGGSGSGSGNKGKGKAVVRAERANPAGHVVFVDDRAEFDTYSAGPSRSKVPTQSLTVEQAQDAGASNINLDEDVDENDNVDLGWEDVALSGSRSKSNQKSKSDKKANNVGNESSPEEEAEAIRSHRLDLLTSLSSHLARLSQLRIAERKLAQTAGLMGKGAARKVREHGWVEDDSVREDRNGEKRRWEGKAFKWTLERRR